MSTEKKIGMTAIALVLMALLGSATMITLQSEPYQYDNTRGTTKTTVEDNATLPKIDHAAQPQNDSANKPQASPPEAQVQHPAPKPHEASEADRSAMEQARQAIAEQEQKAHAVKCESLKLRHEADVAAEDGRHIRALESIGTDYRSRGMGHSGTYQAAIDQENALHQTKIKIIEDNLIKDIAHYGCSQ